jgi:hypothetical protein
LVTTRANRLPPSPGGRSLPVPLLGAAVLVVLAFVTTGGVLSVPPIQVPVFWADVALILAGGVAVAAMVVRGIRGDLLTLWLFGAVAVLTALSIAWSVAPDQSWEESGRTFAYLAAFAVALVLARLSSGASSRVVVAIALSMAALCVWALAVKVFDLDLYGQPAFGRLIAPSGYQNTTGLTGAMALPALVWVAVRRESRLGGALATAGIAIAATVVVLSYSRSAVAAALIATVLPLFWLGSRRRAVLTLALGLLGAVPICAYALIDHSISDDGVAHRGGAGLVLGLIVVVVAGLATLAALATGSWLDAHPQPARRLAQFDRGLLLLVLAVPVLIIIWLLVNSRGPFGEISHLWDKLTSKDAAISTSASRIFNASNSRSAYWRQALSVGEHHLLAGAGVGTFFPAFLRYGTAALTPTGNVAHQAHSYVLETFASFGLIGAVLNLGLFGAWCRDAARAVRGRAQSAVTRPEAEADAGAEADGRWALIGVVIAFGTSSAVDQTWFFPAVAVPALVAAGWITGIARHRGSGEAKLATAGPTRPAVAPTRPLSTRPGAIIALTGLAAVTLAVAWESLQPMRAVQSTSASLNAQGAGNGTAALSDARAAVSQDPFSVTARSQLANVYRALPGQGSLALATLVKATHKTPQNPQAWVDLGRYLTCIGNYPAAIAPLKRATMLDITDDSGQKTLLLAARSRQAPGTLCDGFE